MFFKTCRLCPRDCRINRLKGNKASHSGFCRESQQLRVAHVGAHFGEEPPITGWNGSGTVFFTGCSLGCSFCQNFQISMDGVGKTMNVDELFERVKEMIESKQVHNINLVTPDHFFPHTFHLVSLIHTRGYDLPVVYNLSGYQSRDILKWVNDYADIYLPDYKYSDPVLSTGLARCKDYPNVALEAIAEMVKQKGFLDSSKTDSPLAKKGVLVRHLILPGKIDNSLNALTTLFLEFGSQLPLSLMSQYHPVLPQKDKELNRPITEEEFHRVYSHAMDLGFKELYVQFPENRVSLPQNPSPFLPDFRQKEPFAGKMSSR
jgi:putative pyruvate formate lyase activating enzyme